MTQLLLAKIFKEFEAARFEILRIKVFNGSLIKLISHDLWIT